MRIAISSPERLFLDGLVSLARDAQIDVVARSTSVRECIQTGRNESAYVLVYDLRDSTPGEREYVLGAALFGDFPIIAIADDAVESSQFENRFDRSGSADELLALLRSIAPPQTLVTAKRGRPRGMTHGFPLSQREYDVARLIAQGRTNHGISDALQLREQSVKNVVSTVIRKLGCQNRVQVALRMHDD